MIKINIKQVNNKINTIEVKGHASYDESGKDIVCASVSSIIITTINGLVNLKETGFEYEENDGYVKIVIIEDTKEINALISNMISLLKDLEKQYSKYIKIYEEVQ